MTGIARGELHTFSICAHKDESGKSRIIAIVSGEFCEW